MEKELVLKTMKEAGKPVAAGEGIIISEFCRKINEAGGESPFSKEANLTGNALRFTMADVN